MSRRPAASTTRFLRMYAASSSAAISCRFLLRLFAARGADADGADGTGVSRSGAVYNITRRSASSFCAFFLYASRSRARRFAASSAWSCPSMSRYPASTLDASRSRPIGFLVLVYMYKYICGTQPTVVQKRKTA
jgi:hypothetical protein